MSGLTVRIETDSVVASDDHGCTVALPLSLGRELRGAFERAPRAGPDQLSAGALAALAEARETRPRSTSASTPPWQDDSDGPRLALAGPSSGSSRLLSDVLTARRSEREWASPSLDELATVLVRAGRVIDWTVAPDGYVMTRRPAPSAGARHPLDLHLLAGDVDGLSAGVWRFDALRCELVETAGRHERALARLGEVLGTESPPAALVPAAHVRRTLSRYPAGLSLLWRDAGALLAILQLCATDVGLSSCIAGSCGVMLDEPAAGVVDVGALLLGAAART